jgi:enamine deaminase RidA (YjgF/YER057c/UK114 family)
MKKIFQIFTLVLVVGSMTACKKSFDSLAADPNRATSVPANLILNNVLLDFNEEAFNSTQRWNQYYVCNYAYYGNQEYNWTGYSYNGYNMLKNIAQMEAESTKSVAAPNPYTAIGKFLKAYYLYDLTMHLGDIPVSEALKGLDNVTPKYDTQKQVFQQILTYLEQANSEMATLKSTNYVLASDFYYNNDLSKWQKAVNAFKLRVLIQLSIKEADTDLAIKTKFAETIGNPSKYPLFTSDADNLAFTYNSQYNKYSTNPDNFGFDATRYNMSSTYLGNLTTLKDPRTFFVAEPAAALVAAGKAPNSYDAFVGAGSGEDLATMSANANLGKYSFINRKRYYQTYTAEKTNQIGYQEMCFNIAEAAHRGWITGQNAETWYQNGIKASHTFYGIKDGANTVTFQKPGGTLAESVNYSVDFSYADYYAQSAVKYAGTGTTGLNQILLQKYLAMYQNSGPEGYYNWRRTGVPTFHIGSGTGNSQRVALRFQYPSAERAVNKTNVEAAIASQFGGSDDINSKMWILK